MEYSIQVLGFKKEELKRGIQLQENDIRKRKENERGQRVLEEELEEDKVETNEILKVMKERKNVLEKDLKGLTEDIDNINGSTISTALSNFVDKVKQDISDVNQEELQVEEKLNEIGKQEKENEDEKENEMKGLDTISRGVADLKTKVESLEDTIKYLMEVY